VTEPERSGIRELRQHASRYVAMAKSVKRFAVTDRGELVAYLVPAQEEPTTTFQRLVAAGQVRPATGNILDHLYPDPAELRSLDAIHLATALLIREDVETLLTYDNRLAAAAREHGLVVAAPS
jgi:antitoxin (DNA-binding transcriptional repressor) of toxin-antitoxin stability system